MHYENIHNAIIDRAKERDYNKVIHQLHHIIPRHEDPSSDSVVPLTLKEHRIVHLLRYKMNGSVGNKLAYLLMKGVNNNETHKEFSKMGGTKGGLTTKEQKKGIFSDEWDRSAETKRRHTEGIIEGAFKNSEIAKLAGLSTKEQKKGIFSDEWDRSANNRKMWENLSCGERDDRIKTNQINAKLGGNRAKELQAGWMNPDVRTAACSNGGKTSGKMPHWTNGEINRKSFDCPGEGFYRGRTLKKYKIKGEKI